MTIQDRAAADPGIVKVGHHLADNGDILGIVFCLGAPTPSGAILTPWTAVSFEQATALRDLITELLDDVPDPTAGLDLEA